MKEQINIIIMAVVAIVFFGFGFFSAPKNNDIAKELKIIKGEVSKKPTGEKRDTIIEYRTIQGNTIRVIEQGELTIIRDTIIECKPFIAVLDSIVNNDTVKVSYTYPMNVFDLRMKLKNDSVPIKYITLTKYETKVIERPIWLDILSHSGAALIGYIVGGL